jgi:hypothetical protein
MVDDGFLIGFEDSNGDFVEVGRFNNLADDVTQPLEIKHQNSGERITLDDSGLKMQKIDDDRLYAGAFPGSDADSRLDSALSSAKAQDKILLEKEKYTDDRTISTSVHLQGPMDGFGGATIDAQISIDSRIQLTDMRFTAQASLTVNAGGSIFKNLNNSATTVTVNGDFNRLIGFDNGNITFASGTLGNVVDSSVRVTVTDNGSNVVGDIT